MDERSPKRRRLTPQPSEAPDATSRPPSSSLGETARQPRPSFASPTRASLARYNPAILERRASQSPSKSSPTRPPQQARRSDAIGASEVGGEQALLSRRSRDDDDVPSSPTRTLARSVGDIANALRRTPARPNPRPLPRPAPGEADDIERLFGNTAQRFSNLGLRVPAPPEPELPPPSSDPVSSSSPRGIHSSPSRWKERKRKAMKSSPLKPPPERPGAPPPFEIRRPRSAGGRLDPGTSEARGVPAYDPNAAKRKERDALRKEIQSLRKELEVTRKENERIRQTNATGTALNLADEEAVQEVIRKHLMPLDLHAKPSQSQVILKAALNPLTFFPLGKTPSTTIARGDSGVDEDEVRSHHPVTMKGVEELPYLQLFSPFEISSKVSTLPEEESEPCRQRHSITLRSRETPGLFHARVDMTVNAVDLSISELQVPVLEPAAAPELRPFILRICEGECNRSMQRNIGILSWAMVEWQRVAAERALFWLQITAELATKESIQDVTRKLNRRRAKWKNGDQGADESDPIRSDFTRSDVLASMGRQSHEVKLPSTEGEVWMRIEWRIHFDWAGEAESAITAMIGVPGKWHAADARGSLGEASRLFESLIAKDEGKLDAVRTVVALLLGDS